MTTKTKELISIAESLPIDIKTKLVDKLIDSLHLSQKEIDKLWTEEAERRVKEIGEEKVITIYREEVFKEIHAKFSRWNISSIPVATQVDRLTPFMTPLE